MIIEGRELHPDNRPLIVAEIGASHDGNLDKARQLIEAAAWAGADAVKFQAYTPYTITLPIRSPEFQINEGPWAGYYLHDLYERAYTPRAWLPELFAHARHHNLIPFCSVFSFADIDFCEESLDCPAYKIASFEIVDTPLIEYAAMTNKPLIISTGMASHEEISKASMAADPLGKGNDPLFLHCISAYPCPMQEANVMRIQALAQEFGVAGLSDHSEEDIVPIMATTLGAVLIEKHIKLMEDVLSPDAGFALDPVTFKVMVTAVHEAHEARQDNAVTLSEAPQALLRRSLYVVKHMKKGEEFTLDNIRSIRPGAGLPPSELGNVITNVASKNISAGTPLSWDLVMPADPEVGYTWKDPWWGPEDEKNAVQGHSAKQDMAS